MVGQYQRMLERNLLYTAVTRSKKFLIMCGQYEAFQEAANRQSARRQTCLKDLLQGNSFDSLTIEEENSTTIKVNPQTDDKSEDTTEQVSQPTSDTKQYSEEKTVALKVEETVEEFQVPSESQTIAKNKPFVLTMELIDSYSIDPMIGMEELTPYDFMSK